MNFQFTGLGSQDHREWEKETGGESFDFYGGKKAIVPTRLARNVISAGTL